MDEYNDKKKFKIEEDVRKPLSKIYHRSRISKKALDTFSTNSCTIENDKFINFQTPLTKFTESYTGSKSAKTMYKCFSELPERLYFFKQLTENKIKFKKVEKDIKELEECTFKPKINTKCSTTSILHFSKQQEEYKKHRNSKLLQLKFQYAKYNLFCGINSKLKTSKKNTSSALTVHERLYNESRVYSKINKFLKHY